MSINEDLVYTPDGLPFVEADDIRFGMGTPLENDGVMEVGKYYFGITLCPDTEEELQFHLSSEAFRKMLSYISRHMTELVPKE